MPQTVLNTTWRITCTGTHDDNLIMDIEIDRTGGAVPGLTDLQIVQFIRNQLAAYTSLPVAIQMDQVIRTTE